MRTDQILFTTMAVFGAFVAIGYLTTSYFYRRLRYPGRPSFMKGISLRDDVETVFRKIEPAIHEGFCVKAHDARQLVLEKAFVDPHCVMTIKFVRDRICWQKISVRCENRRWLNWFSSCGLNVRPRRRPNAS